MVLTAEETKNYVTSPLLCTVLNETYRYMNMKINTGHILHHGRKCNEAYQLLKSRDNEVLN